MISTNDIYHFTPRFDYLVSILEEKKLRVSYCLEDYSWIDDYGIPFDTIWGSARITEKIKVGIPMVCFCDIPPKNISNHIEIYGKYGIGFTDDFKQRIAINPLFYLSPKSSVVSLLQQIKKSCDEFLTPEDPRSSIKTHVEKFLQYYKPYKGYFSKGIYKNENHKFYDEREWRYIPPEVVHQIISETKFNELENKHICSLEFTKEDISIIIVENQSEKSKLKNLGFVDVKTIEEYIS